jgi:hypothetical protein
MVGAGRKRNGVTFMPNDILVPMMISICVGDIDPWAGDDLSPPLGMRSAPSARIGATEQHGASASLRRRAGQPPSGHEWAGALRGTHGGAHGGNEAHGMSTEQLGSPGVFNNLREMRDRGLITNEQCVSLATAAVGIRLGDGKEGSNVHQWTKGEAAEAGDLVAGTPIATFLDRSGRTTDRYAGGGSGTPGAHLDHAAIFQKYLHDKAGKRIGMEVTEQYQGSGGPHEHPYYFNSGWGEGNASNYHVIDTAQGHLGGEANPMSRQQYHDATMKAATDAVTPSLGN